VSGRLTAVSQRLFDRVVAGEQHLHLKRRAWKQQDEFVNRTLPAIRGEQPMALTLYNAPQSTCSQRVRFVLNAKGLTFAEKKLDLLAGDQLKPDYLRLNPNGVVPTLVNDGE